MGVEFGPFCGTASLSQYHDKRMTNYVVPSTRPVTNFMKPESVPMTPNFNGESSVFRIKITSFLGLYHFCVIIFPFLGRGQLNQPNKQELQKFPVRTIAHFHPQRINSVKIECSKKSSDWPNVSMSVVAYHKYLSLFYQKYDMDWKCIGKCLGKR